MRALGSVAACVLALAAIGCGSSSDSRTGFGDPNGGASSSGGEQQGGSGENPPPDPAKPGCASDKYTEALPDKAASLSGLSFSSGAANDYLLAALGKRYPVGKWLVEGGLGSSLSQSQGNCIDRFLQSRTSAAAVLRQASTVVHECGHFFDLDGGGATGSSYQLRQDLQFTCKAGDTTSRGGKTFARSRIKTDAYYDKRQACGGPPKAGCDIYADIYLDGSPDDGTFQGGDQGYNSVLEEATQYVNSLASAYAFEDQYGNQVASERDGILTFLWYIERYLKMAKDTYPSAYAAISGDACWRQATLSVWDRGWFYLNASKSSKNLGIDDDAIEALVQDADLVKEIDALRQLECK